MHKMVMPMVMPMVTPLGSAPVHSVGHPHMRHPHTLIGMRQLPLRPQATRMAGMRVTVVTQTLTLGMAMEL